MLFILKQILAYFAHPVAQHHEYEPAHLIVLEEQPLVIEIIPTLRYFSLDFIWANAHMTKSQCATPLHFLNI